MTRAGPPRRHFHVAAREMLLDTPAPCPYLPSLTMDGLAVTPDGQHHVILTLGGRDRLYVGPDQQAVTRRVQILTAALHRGVVALDSAHAQMVGEWAATAWEAAIDALADAIIGRDLQYKASGSDEMTTTSPSTALGGY